MALLIDQGSRQKAAGRRARAEELRPALKHPGGNADLKAPGVKEKAVLRSSLPMFAFNEGIALATALRQWPKVFDQLSIAMVEAGEAGGVLDEALKRQLAIWMLNRTFYATWSMHNGRRTIDRLMLKLRRCLISCSANWILMTGSDSRSVRRAGDRHPGVPHDHLSDPARGDRGPVCRS